MEGAINESGRGSIQGDFVSQLSNSLTKLVNEGINDVVSSFNGVVNALKSAFESTTNILFQAVSALGLELTAIVKLFIQELALLLNSLGQMIPKIMIETVKGMIAMGADMNGIISTSGGSISANPPFIPVLH